MREKKSTSLSVTQGNCASKYGNLYMKNNKIL